MRYIFSAPNPASHILEVSLLLENVNPEEPLALQLPAWRPGRYELGNFAKYLLQVTAKDAEGHDLKIYKTKKDRWVIEKPGTQDVAIHYQVYADHIDGGSTYIGDDQWYLNFINCCMYAEGRLEEALTVALDVPDDYEIACGMERKGKTLYAPNFYRLVDSPAIASPSMQHFTYEVEQHTFHLWFQGPVKPKAENLLPAFEKFTKEQMDVFGGFPTEEYHFLFQYLPYKAHHGVEHFTSTCIVLGPAEDFENPDDFHEFLGISSHELFHSWNIIRIRPAEMYPYDFTQENYFYTGFVAEGVTTYYGDVFLSRSQALPLTWYLKELNVLFKRHFENYGRFNLSVADSSYDLWLDGYDAGVPNRKVSIYVKGAIAALILDLKIRLKSNSVSSLDTVMQKLWTDYYLKDKGYRWEDYQAVAEEVLGESLDEYFQTILFGTAPVEDLLAPLLEEFGLAFEKVAAKTVQEKTYGFKTGLKENKTVVQKVAPDAPAFQQLSLQDEIVAVNGQQVEDNLDKLMEQAEKPITLHFFRLGKLKEVTLEKADHDFFFTYEVKLREERSAEMKERLTKWLGASE